MIAALLGLTAFLVLSPTDRRRLASARYLLLVVGTLMFLLPVVWWNASHDWITFQHTGHHFAAGDVSLWKRIARGGEFVLSQFGVLSPVTFAFVAVALVAAGFAFPRLGRRERFLICFSGLPLAGVFLLSFVIRVQPNWPAAFYPTGIILMVAWALGRLERVTVFRPPTALSSAIAVGLVCTALTYSFPFFTTKLGLDRHGLDPTIRLRGWNDLGAEVDRAIQRLPSPQRTLLVVTTGRTVASELAFYLPEQPAVYAWSGTPYVTSQYDLWGGPRDRNGWDAAIVTHADSDVPSDLAAAFENVRLAARIEVPVSMTRSHAYRLWHASNLQRWPDANEGDTTRLLR